MIYILLAVAGTLQYGVYYFLSNAELYAVYIRSGNSSIIRLSPINRDRASTDTDANSSPFLLPDESSGMENESFQGSYTYDVHHHHTYIAIGQDVIELLLNTDAPNFHRIHIGHTPIQVVARDFGHETYLYVLYEENNRGYVAAYRKYNNRDWRKYGQNNLLVYSPQWFNLSRMSNVLFFSANDWHHSYKVTYVAVAVGYRIYFKEVLDNFDFSINIPKPCDEIVSIKFNEIKQTLFVVCTNVTFYFSYLEYQIYESSLWNRTGQTYFSQDGRIAAIMTNHSGDMTTVTIHGLHFDEVQNKDEKLYQFQHFHHVASRSLIIRGEFITVSNTLHYFCYIEKLEFGIICINVEQALMNVRSQGILNDATLVLPNTHSIACSSYADCPVMYSHHSLFVVQIQTCEQDCESVVMLFNMSTLENTANITGVSLDMHAYKAHPDPILISPPLSDNTSISYETAIQPQTTHTSMVSSSTQPTVANTPLQTPVPPTITTLPPETATQQQEPTVEVDTNTNEELLETCQNDLTAVSTAYDQLLYISITLCVCFCVAMLVTILLLVVMICITRMRKSNVCKDCSTRQK